MASSYRRNFIETEGGLKNVFAHKIFCGWDYGIATKEAANLKSSSIFLELRELLNDIELNRNKSSFLASFWSRMIQLIVNVLVIVAFMVIGYLLWIYLERDRSDSFQDMVVTALFVSKVVLFFPLVCAFIVKYEDYKNPRAALYIILARTFLLGTVIIGVLLVQWIRKASSDVMY